MVGFNKESGEVSVHREDAGRRVDGEADGERFKGRQGTEGAGLAVDEAIYGHVSGFHCLWRYNGVISR